MGYEYRILVELSEKQSLKVQQILLQQIGFYRKPYLEYEYIEFRSPENSDPKYMPNLRLLFEIDGIYILNNSNLNHWYGIESIKLFMSHEQLSFKILDA